MSVLSFDALLAPGASVNNVLSGTILERLTSRREVVNIYAVTDPPTASDEGLFTVDFRLGNVIVADKASARVAAANVGPDRDSHLLARALGDPFDLVQVGVFNGGAAAIRYRILVESSAVA